MNSSELRVALETLGISQGELARRLGNRPETINRWINGVKGIPRNVPGPAAAAINLWLEQDNTKAAEVPVESI
jgi:hypothetical protein